MLTNNSYSIRDVRMDELDAVAGVILAAYEQYKAAMPPAVWEAYSRDIVNVRARMANARLIVAEQDGKILGAVTFFADGSKGENWPPGYTCIRLLAVSPEARGMGIGRALMEECIRRSRALGALRVGLHTTEMMAVALAMYVRMGFIRAPEFDFNPAPGITVTAFRFDLDTSG